MSKRIVILGGGVIGLSAAAACAARGHQVTVIERLPAQRTGCSFGNAGMVVPSHFIPLAAPGMVKLGLKWMWNPESPFYIKPRLNWDLLTWALRFWKASTIQHVERAAPLLRDLSLASRELYVRMAGEGEEFGLVTAGLLMLCNADALEDEARTAETARKLGVPAEVLDARPPRLTLTSRWTSAALFIFQRTARAENFVAALERRISAAGGVFLLGHRSPAGAGIRKYRRRRHE